MIKLLIMANEYFSPENPWDEVAVISSKCWARDSLPSPFPAPSLGLRGPSKLPHLAVWVLWGASTAPRPGVQIAWCWPGAGRIHRFGRFTGLDGILLHIFLVFPSGVPT